MSRKRRSSLSAIQSTDASDPKYIGRAMSQKSPVDATQPDTAPSAQSVTIQSLNLIFNYLCLFHGFKPLICALGLGVSLARHSAAEPD
jgi:hypothetical protein